MAYRLSPEYVSYGLENSKAPNPGRRKFIAGMGATGALLAFGAYLYPQISQSRYPNIAPELNIRSGVNTQEIASRLNTAMAHSYGASEVSAGYAAIVASAFETTPEIYQSLNHEYVGNMNPLFEESGGIQPSWITDPNAELPIPQVLTLVDPNTGTQKNILMSPDREIFFVLKDIIHKFSIAGKPLSLEEIEALEFIMLMSSQTKRANFSQETKDNVQEVTSGRCGLTGQSPSATHGEQLQFHHKDLNCSNNTPNNCIGLLLRIHNAIHEKLQGWSFNDRWFKYNPIPGISDIEEEIIDAWISMQMPGNLELGDVFAEIIEVTPEGFFGDTQGTNC